MVKQWVLLGVFDANYSCRDWRFVDLNPPQALVYVKRIKVVALKYHLSPECTVHCYGPDSSSTPECDPDTYDHFFDQLSRQSSPPPIHDSIRWSL